ncbi:MAG: shikimate dehydrogenase [Bacillota bacterium]|nr:shikimate dehydrogenase [Bacillota bacterium]
MNLKEFLRYRCEKPLYALIGDPVEHSVSPEMHTGIYKADGIEAKYIPIHLKPDEMPAFIEAARRKLKGFNVTIPYKTEIIKYLDIVEGTAGSLKSVNTVLVENGKLAGFNTDIIGVEETLSRNGVSAEGKNAVILGNGGASRTIAFVLCNNGASVTVCGRDIERVKSFIDDLSLKNADINAASFGYLDLRKIDILVNATPVGMFPKEDALPADINIAPNLSFVYDTIYNPLETKLIKYAKNAGIRCANGLSMLIAQGVASDEIWFGRKISEAAVTNAHQTLAARVAAKRLAEKHGKRNIVLAGFMGCGKTTVGKVLSKRLGFTFYDLDRKIEKEEGKSITEIFASYGEEYFRALEYKYIQGLAALTNNVISLGGGAILRRDNFEVLTPNGLVVYLKAGTEFLYNNIKKGKNRPLMKTEDPKKRVIELFEERRPLYEAHCNISVNAEKDVENVADDIINML